LLQQLTVQYEHQAVGNQEEAMDNTPAWHTQGGILAEQIAPRALNCR